MPRERADEGAVDGTTDAPKPARKPRAKSGTRKPRAPKGVFVVTVEIETNQAGLADVTQFVDGLGTDGTTARIKGIHAKG